MKINLECLNCGEMWRTAKLERPIKIQELCRVLNNVQCPNCRTSAWVAVSGATQKKVEA